MHRQTTPVHQPALLNMHEAGDTCSRSCLLAVIHFNLM